MRHPLINTRGVGLVAIDGVLVAADQVRRRLAVVQVSGGEDRGADDLRALVNRHVRLVAEVTITPRASSWRLISSNSASASPCAANSWWKRQIVEWSGTLSSNGRPAKRRNDSRSSTASSRPGSDNPYHCCRSNSFT